MPRNRAEPEGKQVPEQHPGVVPETPSRGRSRRAATKNTTPAAAKTTASMKKEEPMTTTTPTPAELSRLALAEAEATRTETLALTDERQAAAEELRTYLTSGQASLPDLDTYVDQWSRALAAEQVAALLADGAEASVKRATAELINDDTAAADLFADVLREDVFHGHLPIKVVTVATEVKPEDNGGPVLYIVQPKAAKNDAGILSTNLEVTFYRPPLFAPLDATAIEEACRERNYHVEVGLWSSIDRGAFHEDPARIKVSRIFPTVPVLSREGGDVEIEMYANAVRNDLRNAVTYYGQRAGVRLAGEAPEGRADAGMVSCGIVSRALAESRDTRVTVETVHKVSPDALLVGQPVAEMLREAISMQVGKMADNIGRVVSIDHLDVQVPDLLRSRYAEAEPFTVTAHFGIMYRIG
jgi:hypothetical protein